jgi:hypothetical protein
VSDGKFVPIQFEKIHSGLALQKVKRCLTTEYSETTALFNGNFDTDNQIFVP